MHLYKSWDDSIYLTNKFDGVVGHLLEVTGISTVKEIHALVGFKETVQVYRAMHGMKSNVEVFTLA